MVAALSTLLLLEVVAEALDNKAQTMAAVAALVAFLPALLFCQVAIKL
jgi:hypothetical protein